MSIRLSSSLTTTQENFYCSKNPESTLYFHFTDIPPPSLIKHSCLLFLFCLQKKKVSRTFNTLGVAEIELYDSCQLQPVVEFNYNCKILVFYLSISIVAFDSISPQLRGIFLYFLLKLSDNFS